MVEGTRRGFLAKRRRPKWSTLVIVLLAHVIAIFAIASALAPKWTGSVVKGVESMVTVNITAPPDPEPTPDPTVEPQPDEGSAAPEAAKAKPKEVTAPEPKLKVRETPVPKASSSGKENKSGGGESGSGTGGGGQGSGTGSGLGGDGQGNGKPPPPPPLVPVTKPSVRSGNLDNARDFPRPDGGRKTRFGKAVTVHFTVTKDGRARNCRVASSSVDAEATGLVCSLVTQKIRFNPAKDRNGDPIESRYGYRVDFTAR